MAGGGAAGGGGSAAVVAGGGGGRAVLPDAGGSEGAGAAEGAEASAAEAVGGGETGCCALARPAAISPETLHERAIAIAVLAVLPLWECERGQGAKRLRRVSCVEAFEKSEPDIVKYPLPRSLDERCSVVWILGHDFWSRGLKFLGRF